MILIWLILIPLVAGLLGWGLNRLSPLWPRWLALIALGVELTLALILWVLYGESVNFMGGSGWLVQWNQPWIPQFGIQFHLGLDGLSLLMVLLTAVLGIVSVLSSWNGVRKRAGFYYFNLMLVLSGIIGVFLALDLFLFYLFWEVMMIPMFFLIAIWGHARRQVAAVKFFIFTQIGGLLMLVAILGLFFFHGQFSGEYTFDYLKLLDSGLPVQISVWLMLGFFAAFAIKLPAFPLHTWQPDAYVQAPTAVSILLAAILSKTGAYGLIRFIVPLFPNAAGQWSVAGMILGVVGILYGAILAFGQKDLKRLIAYSSISHLGFVLLGIFAWNELALKGVVMQMISHGISVAALFLLTGYLEERLHSRDMDEMGGLWERLPRLGGIMLFFALASLGLPGMGNFIGEFLVLLGSFRVNVAITVLATTGMVAAVIYSLTMIRRIFHGPLTATSPVTDLGVKEMTLMLLLAVLLLWLGLFPQTVLDTIGSIAGSEHLAWKVLLPGGIL